MGNESGDMWHDSGDVWGTTVRTHEAQWWGGLGCASGDVWARLGKGMSTDNTGDFLLRSIRVWVWC